MSSSIGLLIYMGNAKTNYENLKVQYNYRIKDKKGVLRNPHSALLHDIIHVCSNGNIVNSRILSYQMEDNPENCICNILTDDLFKKMEEWSFKHPLSKNKEKIKSGI